MIEIQIFERNLSFIQDFLTRPNPNKNLSLI